MPQGHVLGYERDDLGVDVELREIDRGYAVLLGEKLGQILLGMAPVLMREFPSRSPDFLLSSCARWSCSGEMI